MNLNQNKCINSNTASDMTVKMAKPIKNGRKYGRLHLIKVHFFGMPIKTLGSLGKIRVGRVTGNTHIFFLALACMPSFGFIPHMVSEKKIFKHFYEN